LEENLGVIEILPHPAYSSDFDSSDYHLFWSMVHFLKESWFQIIAEVQSGMQELLNLKHGRWFYRRFVI